MTKREKLLSIKKTIAEIDGGIQIVFCSSKGSETPHCETVPIQEYTISFSSPGRGLLFDKDIVKKALEENLGRIGDTIKYLAQHKLAEAEKEALEESKENLESIQKEIRVETLNRL